MLAQKITKLDKAELDKNAITIIQRIIVETHGKNEAELINAYYETLKNNKPRLSIKALKEVAITLSKHLKHLSTYPGYSAVKLSTSTVQELAQHKWVSDKQTPAEYIHCLQARASLAPKTGISELIVLLNPRSPKDYFKFYSEQQNKTELLNAELDKLNPECQAHIIAGLSLRGHEALFNKARKKVPTTVLHAALGVLDTYKDSRCAIGSAIIEEYLSEDNNPWAENITGASALSGAATIMELHEQHKIPMTRNVKVILGGLVTKALASESHNSHILLMRSVKLNQKVLFSQLLDAGLSPNIITPGHNKQTLGEAVVGHALTKKDAGWLQLAIAHGLVADSNKHLLHNELITKASSCSTSKAAVKEIFALIVKIEQPAPIQKIINTIHSNNGPNSAMGKILSELYSSHYAQQKLSTDNEPKQVPQEIDIF